MDTMNLSAGCNYDYTIGKTFHKGRGTICYSRVLCHSNNINSLTVYHNPKYYHPDWVDWCLNNKQFGDGFITKDAEEGLKEGFKVNVDCPANVAGFAMSALRWNKETDPPLHLLKRGYSIEEIFILSSYLRWWSKKVIGLKVVGGHQPFSGGWKNFKLCNRYDDVMSLRKGGVATGKINSLFNPDKEPNPFIDYFNNDKMLDPLFNVLYKKPLTKTFKPSTIDNFIKEYRECVD